MTLSELQNLLAERKLGLRVTLGHRGWTAIVDRTPIVMIGNGETIEIAIGKAIEAYDKAQV